MSNLKEKEKKVNILFGIGLFIYFLSQGEWESFGVLLKLYLVNQNLVVLHRKKNLLRLIITVCCLWENYDYNKTVREWDNRNRISPFLFYKVTAWS